MAMGTRTGVSSTLETKPIFSIVRSDPCTNFRDCHLRSLDEIPKHFSSFGDVESFHSERCAKSVGKWERPIGLGIIEASTREILGLAKAKFRERVGAHSCASLYRTST
jgi:hypothetical protein